MPRVLVASLGFTVDFAVRRVADLGRGEVRHFIGVGLHSGDEDVWKRVEEAFKLLSHYLTSLGIPSELRVVRLGRSMVREARDALARASSLAGPGGLVEVYLTGGPRILTATLVIAALTSTPEVRDKIVITAYGEGFKADFQVHVGLLAKLLSLDEASLGIVHTLARTGGLRAEDLRNTLGMKRSTLYKKLKELSGMGLLRSEAGIWRVHEDLEKVI